MTDISVVIPHNRGGGTYSASISHIRALKEGGYDVNSFVVFGKDSSDNEHIKLLKSYVSYLNPFSLLSAIIKFRNKTSKNVIAMHFDSIIFCFLMKKIFRLDVNVYAFIHTNMPAYYSSLMGVKKIIFKRILLLMNGIEGVVFLTEDQVEWFQKNFLYKVDLKVVCIPNPYIPKINNTTVFGSPIDDKGRHGFVFLGRLSQEKNVDFIIKAFSIYCCLGGSDNLYIYGDGSEREKLSKLIISLKLHDRITLCGNTSNPVDALHRARTLVTASQIEGFPVVLLEALDAQLNIITSNCSSACYELFDLDGVVEREFHGEHISILDVPWQDECISKYGKEMRRLSENAPPNKYESSKYLSKYKAEVIFKLWVETFK